MNYTIFYGVNYMYGYEYGSSGKTRHITRKCKQLLCNYYLYDEFVLSKLQLQGICIFLRYFIIRILRNINYDINIFLFSMVLNQLLFSYTQILIFEGTNIHISEFVLKSGSNSFLLYLRIYDKKIVHIVILRSFMLGSNHRVFSSYSPYQLSIILRCFYCVIFAGITLLIDLNGDTA